MNDTAAAGTISDPSPKGTAPDFSTLVIYVIVGGLIIGSALFGF